ncbi:MAG: hypothetical protein ACRC5A_01920 [Enterobacteriaceae bacterium]
MGLPDKISKTEIPANKVVMRGWRKTMAVIFSIAGILLLCGSLTALGLYLVKDESVLMAWLQRARVPLFIWRLSLYSIVAAMWLHRVRSALLRQVPSPGSVYRLEVMMVCLALLIELTSYRWGM